MQNKIKSISVIVPVYNEQDNIGPLLDQVDAALQQYHLPHEIIVIDDGSKDNTMAVLREMQKTRPNLRLIQFRRNYGQTAAMTAGFDHAQGDVIIPLDGDLQNDPADIPRLIDKIEQGYDVVSGWRKNRKDKLITRKVPSWIANWIIGKITGVSLHDYGCSLKAYRKEVIDHMHLYGEMHRFIPAIAQWYGASVTEIEVNHRPRVHGVTKYGLNRTFKVILDLLTIKFLGSFSTRPLHIFGGMGLITMLLAFITGVVTIYQKLFDQVNLNRNGLFYLTILFSLAALIFIFMGLLAELVTRTYHESQSKPIYIVRHILEPDSNSGNDHDLCEKG